MARRFILFCLRYSGFMRMWRWRHRRQVTILMLHGVMDKTTPSAWAPLRAHMSPSRLDDCLRELGRRYRFVSIDEAADMLEGRSPVIPYSLVLTFDDGYRNQVSHAGPILAKHQAPGIIYLVPGHMTARKPFWFDRLDYAIQSLYTEGKPVTLTTGPLTVAGASRSALRDSYRRMRETARSLFRTDEEMLAALDALADAAERQSGRALKDVFEHDDWSRLLTWTEAKAGHPWIAFGSHTMDHVRLAHMPTAVAVDQCRTSRAVIEANLGTPCRHFCYPDGSVNAEVAEAARASGYRTAVTVDEGANAVGVDLMKLRRINLATDGSTTELLAAVSGLSLALSRAIGRVRRLVGRLIPRAAGPSRTVAESAMP